MIRQQSYSLILLVLAVAIMSETIGVVDAYEWGCNLFCYNKGTCRFGHGKFGAYNGIDSTEALPFEQELHDDGMYCTCPVGFTGLQCEIKYVTCGRDNHTCFNGSACVKERSSNNGDIFYRCECDVTESVMDAPYAGKYCEHIATIFCEGGDGFSHGDSFCTNGGRCKDRDPNSITKHHGCECPEGWKGEHCELPIKKVGSSVPEEIAHEFNEILSGNDIFWIIMAILVGIFVTIYFRRYHLIKKKAKKTSNRRYRKNQQENQQEMASFTDASRDII